MTGPVKLVEGPPRAVIEQAACAGITSFFDAGDPAYPYAISQNLAARVCDSCPVFALCEAYAVTQRHGFWAGQRRDRPDVAEAIQEWVEARGSEPFTIDDLVTGTRLRGLKNAARLYVRRMPGVRCIELTGPNRRTGVYQWTPQEAVAA